MKSTLKQGGERESKMQNRKSTAMPPDYLLYNGLTSIKNLSCLIICRRREVVYISFL